MQRHLDPRHPAPTDQPRRDDPRVIEHGNIPPPQQPRQRADHAVLQRRALDDEQLGDIARHRRMVGNERAGQVEIEIVNAQGDIRG